ncbi:hypothetical protein PAHAL_2G335500 [Panicum hallii]|uniref:BZIP domain-containing protein n=1 Tax=Panicum hallii TaxID=206008 RepID=A0A2T8KR77_9POAL|nr:protein LITTLE ZIPPER 1-like isoform X1 [Panicum hallii]PVH64693.1 hypothetical protein PAHAL_2G335500 [Panicum hallii]
MGSIFIYSLKALGTLHLQVTEFHGIYLSRSKHTASGNMCSGSWSTKRCPSLVVFNLKRRQQQTKPHVLVAIRRRLRLRRSRAGVEAMEMVNLKLYLENRCIIAENERLKEKASALRRENLALRQNLSKTAAEAKLPAAGAGAGAA